ncbi:MAG: hypothetical protein R2707_03810 [Acidimicrobiales bacterium]
MRVLVLLLALSTAAAACADDVNVVSESSVPVTSAPPAEETTTTAAPPVDRARAPDVRGWLVRYTLDVSTSTQYPVVTVSPDFAPGVITVGDREVVVDADTEYSDNCLVIVDTVRSPPGTRRPGYSRGCYVFVGLAADGSAAWMVELWSDGAWEPDPDGLWVPVDAVDETLIAGRLVGVGGGEYTIDTGSIRYVLPGLADPALSSDCPPLDDAGFFTEPGLYHWAVVDTDTGTVTGVRCEYQYSD